MVGRATGVRGRAGFGEGGGVGEGVGGFGEGGKGFAEGGRGRK